MRAHRGGRRASEKRRFLYYSVYAWGCPILMTCICALMQFHPNIPSHHVRPGFSVEKCWFNSKQFLLLIIIFLLVIILYYMICFCFQPQWPRQDIFIYR